MGKKPKSRAIGRFGSLNKEPPPADDARRGEPMTERFTTMYRQAETEMVLAVDKLRTLGGSLSEHTLIVADIADERTRHFARKLGHEADGADDANGWIAILPNREVAAALREYQAPEHAAQVTTPLAPGQMRLLFTAEGKVGVYDIDAFPPLAHGGEA